MGFITDLLKDIPLSAVIKEKLVDAEKEISVLQSDNSTLKTENKNLNISLEQKNKEIDRLNQIIHSLQEGQSIEKLNEAEYKILKIFFDANDEIIIEKIAQALSMKIQIVQYHVENLLNSGYVELSTVGSDWFEKEPDKYRIKQKGRAFIIENQP
ncbi:MAG: hypothetical protein P8012_05940 [Desulfobacterales bacterium]